MVNKDEWTGELVEYMREIPRSGKLPYLALVNPAGPELGMGKQTIYSLLIPYRNKIVRITIEEIEQ